MSNYYIKGINMSKIKFFISFIVLIIVLLLCLVYYYTNYSKPIELIAAEETLRHIMKSPKSFQVESAYFKVIDGHPTMTIRYTSSNSFGVPLSGYAKFVYNAGKSLPSPHSDSSTDKLIREMMLKDIDDINKGIKNINPFDYCNIESIDLVGNKISDEMKNTLVIFYSMSLNKLRNNNIKKFNSKIKGSINEVTPAGLIKKTSLDNFSYTYVPKNILSWSD